MKKIEVINKLLYGINPTLEKEGFKLNKKNNNFIRKVNDSNQIIDFFFYKRGKTVEVEPAIRIKIESIEKIYQSISSIEGRPYCTLGNHFSDILLYINQGKEKGARDIEQSNWLVVEEKDIDKLIQVIPEYLEESIFSYFEENSSILRVDELLNKHPKELSVHNYLYPLRVNIAIIAAKLNKNPYYNKLLYIYEEELQEAEKTYKEDFYMLKKILNDL